MAYVFGIEGVPVFEMLFIIIVLMLASLIFMLLEIRKLRKLIAKETVDITRFENDLAKEKMDITRFESDLANFEHPPHNVHVNKIYNKVKHFVRLFANFLHNLVLIKHLAFRG